MIKIGKSAFPIFFALLVNSFITMGQKNEIGIGIGGVTYTGEVSPVLNPLDFRPAGNIFYRRNFSPVVSLKVSILSGRLQASEVGSTKPVPSLRQKDFSGLLTEIGGLFEYNFFNYRDTKFPYKATPYLTGGLSVFNFQGIKIAMPLGIGFKYKLAPQTNFGLEFVARKSFTDKLDGIDDERSGPILIANPVDKDWYYFLGASISYTFYGIICPEF